jgi:hypothetical protein
MSRLMGTILPLLILGCASTHTPVIPNNAVYFCGSFRPCPPEYSRWWEQAVAAAQTEPAISLDALRWYVVPGVTYFPCRSETGRCYGRWLSISGEPHIILSENAVLRRISVQHEMLHAILGDGDHGPAFVRAESRLNP